MQVKVTVTGLLFQPALSGAGDADAVIANGGYGCNVNCTVVLAVLPALLIAVPLIVCSPTAVAVTGEGQVSTPESASLHVNVTVALAAVMIPLLPGCGETEAVIVGGA